MPALPARWFDPEPPYLVGDAWMVTVRDVDSAKQPVGEPYMVRVSDLSNAETFKAAARDG